MSEQIGTPAAVPARAGTSELPDGPEAGSSAAPKTRDAPTGEPTTPLEPGVGEPEAALPDPVSQEAETLLDQADGGSRARPANGGDKPRALPDHAGGEPEEVPDHAGAESATLPDPVSDEPATLFDPVSDEAATLPDPLGREPATLPNPVSDEPATRGVSGRPDRLPAEFMDGPDSVEREDPPKTDAEDTKADTPQPSITDAAPALEPGTVDDPEDEDVALPAAEDDEEDEDGTLGDGAFLVREKIVLPRLTVTWPPGLAPHLPHAGLDPARLVEEAGSLWDAVADAVAARGPGCLWPEGLRWSPDFGWQLALTPGYRWDGGFTDRSTDDPIMLASAWRRDLRAIALTLAHAAAGRRPVDAADARRLADLDAGHLPAGLDALVQALLRGTPRPGDLRPARRVTATLARPAGGRLAAQCFLESATGSRKSRGRGLLDNEDAALTRVTGRTARLAIFDGTTDDGSGSGFAAAHAAVRAVAASWDRGADDPVRVLADAEAAVCDGTTGASTAVVARAVDGRVRLAALGDSAAWLVRPDPDGLDFVAWRLTPSHTVYAEKCRAGAADAWGHAEITRYLGGAGDDPFVTEFDVAAGDLLLLATDGVTAEDREEWFGDALCRLARDRAQAQRPLAAGLAADLIGRAEALGGWDNATALVTRFDEA